MKRDFYIRFLLIGILLSQSACFVLKARPAENSGFLPKPEVIAERRERAPFYGYWVEDPIKYFDVRKSYRKVYIAPIDTTYVRQTYNSARGSKEIKQARIEEAEELANYFRERLKLSLQSREEMLIVVTDNPGEMVLNLNLALVQLVPTNPGINLIGTVAGAFVPGGGLIKIAGEGSVAMEGYVSSLSPQQSVLEQFSDREGQKASPFSLKDYQRYEHIRVAIDDWSNQIAELLSTAPEHTVEDSLPVSINPL